jgi:hypothetical protein
MKKLFAAVARKNVSRVMNTTHKMVNEMDVFNQKLAIS